jgi:hypothetical protein
MFLKINGVEPYLWRAVDHEGKVFKTVATKRRDKEAALNRRSAQQISRKFATAHGSFQSHSNLERHLLSRPAFKERYAAALNV